MAAGLCTRARFWGTGEELLNFESSDDQQACAISRGSERAATARTQHILESEESYDAELEERGDRPHRTSGWPWAKAAGPISTRPLASLAPSSSRTDRRSPTRRCERLADWSVRS
jgi:hypothetical protein